MIMKFLIYWDILRNNQSGMNVFFSFSFLHYIKFQVNIHTKVMHCVGIDGQVNIIYLQSSIIVLQL